MSGGNISGNMETSILFDVSAVAAGSQAAIQHFVTMQGVVERTSASFQSSSKATSSSADAMERAAEAVELLSMRMLAMQAMAVKAGLGVKQFAADASAAATAVNSANQTIDSFSIGQAKKKGNKSDAEARAAESAAEAKRIADERRRRAEMIAQREYEDSRRFSAGARLAPSMRNDANNLSQGFFNRARDLHAWERGRVAAESMRDAIFESRVALDPLVGMQARLAEEADEFQRNMRLAVAHGHMNQEQAEELLRTYRMLTAEQMVRARNEQQSFLGMRNFGFIAQQGAYAIEDFAQVFGTMGVAGGIRAAGNNLTAMAAVAGPMTGVFASISAAAVMIGLHLWESHAALQETANEADRLEKLTSDMEKSIADSLKIREQSANAHKASFSDLLTMFDENIEQLREINRLEEARNQTAQKLLAVNQNQNVLSSIEDKESLERRRFWIQTLLGIDPNSATLGFSAVKDAFTGVLMKTTEEGVRLAEERQKAEALIAVEMQRQENHIKRINSEEYKRLQLIQAQSDRLRDQAMAMRREGGAFASRNILDGQSGDQASRIRAFFNKEFDATDAEKMATRISGFGDEKSGTYLFANTEKHLSSIYGMIEDRRNRMMFIERNAILSDEKRMEIQEYILNMNKELLHIEEQRVALNEAGREAAAEARSLIMSQFEGLNETLAFENSIVEARKEANRQIEIAIRSNRITEEQADNARQQLEDALALTEEKFQAEKRIEELQERQKEIQVLLNTGGNGANAAISRGSQEDYALRAGEIRSRQLEKQNKPIIDELRNILLEIKQQREDLKEIGMAEPEVAALQGF